MLRSVLAWLPYVVVVVVCVRPVGWPEMEPDMWWHMAVGRWMAQHGTFISIDPFSYPDTPWVAYSWLFELLLYKCTPCSAWAASSSTAPSWGCSSPPPWPACASASGRDPDAACWPSRLISLRPGGWTRLGPAMSAETDHASRG